MASGPASPGYGGVVSAWHVDVGVVLGAQRVLVTGADAALGALVAARLLRAPTPPQTLVLFIDTPAARARARAHVDVCADAPILPFDEESASEWVRRTLEACGCAAAAVRTVRVYEVDYGAASSGSASGAALGLTAEAQSELAALALDVVLHCAPLTAPSLYTPLADALAVTAHATAALLRLCARIAPALSAFVLLSSTAVAPLSRASVLEERLAPLPRGVDAQRVLTDPALAASLQRYYASPAALALAVTEHVAVSLAARVHVPLAVLRAPTLAPSRRFPEPGWCPASLVATSPFLVLTWSVATARIHCIPARAEELVHVLPVDALAEQALLVAAATRHAQLEHVQHTGVHVHAGAGARVAAVPRVVASTVPRAGGLVAARVSLPALPPSPARATHAAAVAAAAVAPRFFHACSGVVALRWAALVSALSAYCARYPLSSVSSSGGGVYVVPTRAHWERDYVVHVWLPARVHTLLAAPAAAAALHAELAALRALVHRLRAFLRYSPRVQDVALQRLCAAQDRVHEALLCTRGALTEAATHFVFAACHGLRVHALQEDAVPRVLDAAALAALAHGADDVLAEAGPRGVVGDVRFLLQSSYHTPQRLASRAEQVALRTAVLSSSAVRAAMQREVQQRGRDSADVEREVVAMLDEMAAALDVAQLRAFGFAFRKLWQTLYAQVAVNSAGLERVAARLREAGAAVVYLPSHRSYMDFLVLSYVLFARHLPLPHIAAGNDFLGLSLAVHVLRCGGAFFLRRSLGDDALYAALLREYVQALLARGCSLEFFIEGTRARYGKSLRPKFGLLKTVVDAWRERRVRAVYLVPVHINYERLVEEEMYPRELLGLPKRKESLTALLDGVRHVWRERYGRIAIELGVPIALDAAQWARWHALEPHVYRAEVARLGERVVHEINALSVWSPVVLVSALLLAHARAESAAFSRAQLVAAVHALREELLQRGVGRDDWLRGESAAAMVRLGLAQVARVVSEVAAGTAKARVVVDAAPESVLLLATHRNKLLHVFAHDAYVLLALRARRTSATPLAALCADVRFLDTLFHRDVIDRPDPHSPPPTRAVLARLAHPDLGLVRCVASSAVDEAAEGEVALLSGALASRHAHFCLELLWPFVESYYFAALWAALVLSDTPGALDVNAALPALQRAVLKLHLQGRTYAAEAANKETLTHALQSVRALAATRGEAEALAARLAALRRGAHDADATRHEDTRLLRASLPAPAPRL